MVVSFIQIFPSFHYNLTDWKALLQLDIDISLVGFSLKINVYIAIFTLLVVIATVAICSQCTASLATHLLHNKINYIGPYRVA